MPDDITISQEDDGTRGAYRMDVEGSDHPAELTWRKALRGGKEDGGEVRIADHTFTPPEARGKGVAFKLVEALIADARETGFTIIPACPYVAVQFDRVIRFDGLPLVMRMLDDQCPLVGIVDDDDQGQSLFGRERQLPAPPGRIEADHNADRG